MLPQRTDGWYGNPNWTRSEGVEKMSECMTLKVSDLPELPIKADADVWIQIALPSAGIDSRFFGMMSVGQPYGPNGPAVGTTSFNLTAYVKHLIEQAKPVTA